MFDLDPLNRPIAVIEILVLLTVAVLVGWFLARLILNNRINALHTAIADQEAELDECRRSRATTSSPKAKSVAALSKEPLTPVTPVASATAPDQPLYESTIDDAPLALGLERPIIDPILPTPNPVVPAASGNSEAAILQRIAARASEINFDRIGLASAAEADDLKDIVGIGPFLERKLHSLGIYTFRQIANFDKEDIDKINDIIEFFPGRIERDNWVDQSKLFYEQKYGKKLESPS